MSIDDSAECSINFWFLSGEIANSKKNNSVYYTLLINGGVSTVFWVNENNPDILYTQEGFFAGNINTKSFSYRTWTKKTSSVKQPAENYFNIMRLKEYSIEHGIDPDLFIDIDCEWGQRGGAQNAGWCFPAYLVADGDAKIVFRTHVRKSLGDEEVQIICTAEKIDGIWVRTIIPYLDSIPETFEYLGEEFSIKDADYIYYNDLNKPTEVTFNDFGYIRSADGEIKVVKSQEIDGLVVTDANVTFSTLYYGEIIITDTDVLLEGEIEFIGKIYKERASIAEPSGFVITEPLNTTIPFGSDYQHFLVYGNYDPEEEYTDIFSETEYREVKATFQAIRFRVTSRATGGDYIELSGITEIIN